MMWDARRLRLGAFLAAIVFTQLNTPAVSETLPEALVKAYQGNPMLTLERAKLRATDENVPQALSGYRPQVTVGLERRPSCGPQSDGRRRLSIGDPEAVASRG